MNINTFLDGITLAEGGAEQVNRAQVGEVYSRINKALGCTLGALIRGIDDSYTKSEVKAAARHQFALFWKE